MEAGSGAGYVRLRFTPLYLNTRSDQEGRNSCVTVLGMTFGFTFADRGNGMDCRPTTDSALLLLW